MSSPTNDNQGACPSFVLLGMDNHYSYQVARGLLDKPCRPHALILAESTASVDSGRFADIDIRVNHPAEENLVSLCDHHRLSCHHTVNTALPELLTELAVDFLLVACWPEKLTPAAIDAVNCAALNLHPSMLPRYRGRNPVADQLDSGESRLGVSLHLINDEFDAGDIILQRGFELVAPVTRQAIELAAAANGVDLFIRALRTFHQPGWQPIPQQSMIDD